MLAKKTRLRQRLVQPRRSRDLAGFKEAASPGLARGKSNQHPSSSLLSPRGPIGGRWRIHVRVLSSPEHESLGSFSIRNPGPARETRGTRHAGGRAHWGQAELRVRLTSPPLGPAA